MQYTLTYALMFVIVEMQAWLMRNCETHYKTMQPAQDKGSRHYVFVLLPQYLNVIFIVCHHG